MASFTDKIDLFSFKNDLAPNFPMSFNKTCFEDKEKFTFDETAKILTILPNSLKFYPNRIYQFMISATYLDTVYSQKTNLILKNVGEVPNVELKQNNNFSPNCFFNLHKTRFFFRCKFPATCKPFPAYQKINPSTQMMITSFCRTGCQNVSTLTYKWNLFRFFKISEDDVQEKWVQFVNNTYVKGDDTSELTMASDLFLTNPDVTRWKIEFSLEAISKQNGKN